MMVDLEGTAARPDTLNLEDVVQRALQHMANVPDRSQGYVPYFNFRIRPDPPTMQHSQWNYNAQGRLVDAFILARQMTGSSQFGDIEERMRTNLLKGFSEDIHLFFRDHSSYTEHVAHMHDQRTVLMGLVTWYLATGSPIVLGHAKEMVRAIDALTKQTATGNHYPSQVYHPNDGWRKPYLQTEGDHTPASGRQLMPILRYLEISGDDVALELAERFAYHNAFESGVFGADGSLSSVSAHVHSALGTVAGLLKYGSLASDMRLVEVGKRVFDWIYEKGGSFGWVPEGMRKEEVCETCCVADMVECAILLAKAGYQHYWNHAERFVRNQLVENQLCDIDWIGPGKMDDDDVEIAERILGAFAGWALPNDFTSGEKATVMADGERYDIMECCTPHAVHGLYIAWANIVTRDATGVHVNLLLNRDTRWLEVISYLPYEGKVELLIHDAPRVYVRLPDWVDKGSTRLEVDGSEREAHWVGDYVRVGELTSGQLVRLTFLLRTEKRKETVYGKEYWVEWKGDTVVGISPEGEVLPLYRRAYMKGDRAPLRETTLHVPDQDLVW